MALCLYNGEKYINDQLSSILNQTIPPLEIVICDDGSTDNGISKACALLDLHLVNYRIIRNTVNRGVANNFLNAIKLCTSEYVFTSDQDDLWREDKAANILDVFEKNPSAMLVFSDGDLIDSDNVSLNCTIWESVGITDIMLTECKWFDYMLPKHIVTGATMAIKKELIEDIEYVPEGFIHDEWFALKAAIKNAMFACPEKLIRYRQHTSNVIGMKTNFLPDKIKRWFGRIHEMPDVRIERIRRFTTFEKYFKDIFSCEQKQKLDMCLKFWNEASYLTSMNKIAAIKWIVCNQRNRNYDIFYNGKKGVIRDLIGILFR